MYEAIAKKVFSLTFLSIFLCLPGFSQKLTISDLKDPFTNDRTLYMGNIKIAQFIETSSVIRIRDTTTAYFLTFMLPNSFKWVNDLDTSHHKMCLIKCLDGKIISGKWDSETPFNSKSDAQAIIVYSFSKEDFELLSQHNTTDIKLGNAFFHIENKRQNKLKELCSKMLLQLK
jgi:hypothetical protein